MYSVTFCNCIIAEFKIKKKLLTKKHEHYIFNAFRIDLIFAKPFKPIECQDLHP